MSDKNSLKNSLVIQKIENINKNNKKIQFTDKNNLPSLDKADILQ